VDSSGGERPSSLILSQQDGGAEGSLIRVVPRRVGAALTKPGCGPGERDGEEYARNRRFTSLKVTPARTWWMWVGGGAHPLPRGSWGTLGAVYRCCPEGHEEGLRRTHGDAAGTQSGSSFVERMTVNTGTTRDLALHHMSSVD
jgi:hypothetical protein